MANDPATNHYGSDDEIRYGSFQDADLRRHTFAGTILTHGNFQRANCLGIRMSVRAYRTDFSGASFRDANLSDANFFGCSFKHASLRGADLSRTKFGNSNLVHADLTGAKLTDANLLTVTGLTAKQLVAAENWHQATIAPHLRTEAEALDLLRRRRENTRVLDGPILGPSGLIDDLVDLVAEESVEAAAADRQLWPAMIVESPSPKVSDGRLRPVSAPSPAMARRAAQAYRDVVQSPRPKYSETGEISVSAFEALRSR